MNSGQLLAFRTFDDDWRERSGASVYRPCAEQFGAGTQSSGRSPARFLYIFNKLG